MLCLSFRYLLCFFLHIQLFSSETLSVSNVLNLNCSVLCVVFERDVYSASANFFYLFTSFCYLARFSQNVTDRPLEAEGNEKKTAKKATHDDVIARRRSLAKPRDR